MTGDHPRQRTSKQNFDRSESTDFATSTTRSTCICLMSRDRPNRTLRSIMLDWLYVHHISGSPASVPRKFSNDIHTNPICVCLPFGLNWYNSKRSGVSFSQPPVTVWTSTIIFSNLPMPRPTTSDLYTAAYSPLGNCLNNTNNVSCVLFAGEVAKDRAVSRCIFFCFTPVHGGRTGLADTRRQPVSRPRDERSIKSVRNDD